MKRTFLFILLKLMGILLLSSYFPLQWAISFNSTIEDINDFRTFQITFMTLGTILLLIPKKLFYNGIDKFKNRYTTFIRFKPNHFNHVILLLVFLIFLSLYPLHFLSILNQYPHNSLINIANDALVFMRETKSFTNVITNSLANPYDVDPNQLEIPNIDIYLRQDKIDELNSNLPETKWDWKNGFYQRGNETLPVRIKYRGSSPTHWFFPKKSFAIKVDQEDVLNFTRRFDLVVPEHALQFSRSMYSFMGKQMGLMTQESYDVAVFLNNKHNGHYTHYEYLDESFLRKRGRMPGMLYKLGMFNGTFTNVGNWDARATFIDETDPEKKSKELEIINSLINNVFSNDTIGVYTFLTSKMENNLEHVAFLHLLGDQHVDDNNNQVYYFNPTNGKFESVMNDPIMTDLLDFHLNRGTNQVIKQVSRFPDLVDQKNKIRYDYATSENGMNRLIQHVDELEARNRYAIKKDLYKLKDTANNFISSRQWREEVESIKERLGLFKDSVIADLTPTNVTVYISPQNHIIFDINAQAGIHLSTATTNLKGCYNLVRQSQNTSTSLRQFCGGIIPFDETIYPGQVIKKRRTWNIAHDEYVPAPLRYTYYVEPLTDTTEKITDFSINAVSTITHHPATPVVTFVEDVESLPILGETYSEHPWDYLQEKQPQQVIFTGARKVTEDIIIDEQDTLVIKPGTTIYMSEGVSIIAKGKIIVNGTSAQPVTFKQLSPGKAWGALALQGQHTAGSMITHTTFTGGSGAKHSLVHYTGMLSAYNANLTCHYCTLEDNQIEDDMINVKLGEVDLRYSTLINAFGDAIDIDIGTGTIIDTIILNPANDGIDLMTSDIIIEKNRIIGAGDKGISIGEQSKPRIIDNTIEAANIGIASKDGSEPIIIDNSIKESNVAAVAGYAKNWRYSGGGHGMLINNSLCNNKEIIIVDPTLLLQEGALPYHESSFSIQEGNNINECTLENCEIQCPQNNKDI